MVLREAKLTDAPAIESIYAGYVTTSTCTWQETPGTLAEREAWLSDHGERHPVLVAEDGGQVIGWASLSPFNRRSGYRHTVEDSVYVREGLHRRGLGRALLAALIERARALGHHAMIAGTSADQVASIELHRALGFVEVARMPEVGTKFGRWLDLVYLQLTLQAPRAPRAPSR
jgi:L-amino acid N-acyltransferase